MRKKVLFLVGMMSCSLIGAQEISKTWVSDKGNGTYQNPVLYADYSDPDACAVGDDFYMTASSFNCIPGLPILHSRDLVNWSLVNYALPKLEPETFFNRAQHGKGVWAPAIRFHQGEFYIYWGDPDYGIYMTKTKDPKGDWEQPILVKAGKGMIDATPLWDEDGKVYLVYAYAGSRSGVNSILVMSELNTEGTKEISAPVMVFDGNDGKNHTVEGPKLYKRNGYYYIFAPAGGVATGWQLVLRSKNIYGPYESKIVMAQGKTRTNGPHQGAWVNTNRGESWFINFQDQGAYGRVIHLNPMKWEKDWPVIGVDKDKDGCGEPVSTYQKPDVGKTYPVATPPESDEFNTRHLGLQWQWHANKQDTYGFTTDLGYMRLYAGSLTKEFVNFWEVPNLLMQKFPAEEFTATTRLTFTAKQDGEQAGLIVMGWDYSYLSLRKDGQRFILQQVICKDAELKNPEQIKELARFPAEHLIMPGVADNEWKTVHLQVTVRKGAVCTFSYSLDGKKYMAAGDAFIARQGKWIGAKIGVFCVTPADGNRGWADVDWFRICAYRPTGALDVNQALDYCAEQTQRTLTELKTDSGIDYAMMPRNILAGGQHWNCRKAAKEEWCAGFWPGVLWYNYEYTNDKQMLNEAERFTSSLGFLSHTPAYDHDLGFLVFCSYGNGYRLTKNPAYKQIILDTADTLATLFNPTVGTILSWPREVEPRNWPHNTIMDNMINLEMLFWAAKNGGNPYLYDVAVAHADKTMKCQFRPDYTSYHVAVYDTITGNLIKGVTHQGYADNTLWARGQAWAIYGFATVYRETKDPKYLDFVQKVTDVYLERLPEDKVPYWDFDDPAIPHAPRDASAAAVVAAALLELSTYLPVEKGKRYQEQAIQMLTSLSSDVYQSRKSNSSFLLHSTGHWPNKSEIDASIIYADYYYIEALLRLKRLQEGKPVVGE